MISRVFSFLSTDASVLDRVIEHLGYTIAAVGCAALCAIPLGIWIGHTRRGVHQVTAVAGALRALPSLGLLVWLTLELSFGIRLPMIPAVIVLVILAVPPILAGVVTGMTTIGYEVVDTSRAAGFTEGQIIWRVELPLSAPAIIGGIRSATVQVIATATVVAYIGLSGLGRYLIDGLALHDYPQMLAGAMLVTVLAFCLDIVFALLQRIFTPKGL